MLYCRVSAGTVYTYVVCMRAIPTDGSRGEGGEQDESDKWEGPRARQKPKNRATALFSPTTTSRRFQNDRGIEQGENPGG